MEGEGDLKVGIVLDSTLDVTDDLREKVYWVPLKVEIAGETFLDGTKSLDEIFSLMREKNAFAKTSQPSPNDFEDVYQKALKENDAVISLHISEKLSGTIGSAKIASKVFDDRVRVFDTGAATIVAQAYVEKILEMSGKSVDEIMDELQKLRESMKLFLTVGSLEFLKRSGRLKGMEAMIGSLLKLRPVIEVVEGALTTKKILRGEKKVFQYMIRLLERLPKNSKVFVGNIHAPEKGRLLKEHAKKLGLDVKEVPVRSSALSVHLGPGSYGIAVFER